MLVACTLATLPARADAKPPLEPGPMFRLDPVTETAWLTGMFVVAATSEILIGTGELEAQLPDDEAELIFLDRWVAERDDAALRGAQISDLGVLTTAAWTITDTVFAALGHRPDSALTYATLYLESGVTTWCVANLFKLAIRRPRPRAYIELRETGAVNPDTQEALSFYSLHTALTASLGATASYLALTRPGTALEKWLVVSGSIVATAVVGGGRMASGAHFTTDVLAGLAAGTAVGVMVAHVHRRAPVAIAASADAHGGTLGIQGRF